MYNGSHSRHSYPFDKSLPIFPVRLKSGRLYSGDAKKCLQRFHNVKQRQYNRKLTRREGQDG